MATLAFYTSLGPADRSRISSALQAIINGAGAQDRVALVQVILDDVADGRGRVTYAETAQALLAAKTLARVPDGTRAMAQTKNLRTLLKVLRTQSMPLDAQVEALRCVSNCLLVVNSARDEWISIGGGEACVEVLERDTASTEVYFPAARSLYLLLVTPSPFIRKLVEQLRMPEILAHRLDTLLEAYLAAQPWSREAVTDTLKVAFTLLLQYPRMLEDAGGSSRRILGELWDDKFEVLVPTLLRLFHNLPPTPPIPLTFPLTHCIHALLNVPIKPFASLFFPLFPYSPSTQQVNGSQPPESFSQRALSYLQRRSSGPPPPHHAPRRSSPHPPSSTPDTLKRALTLLDMTLAHYFPPSPSNPRGVTEVDDPRVRQLAKQEDTVIEEVIPPLVLLVNRIARMDDAARARARAALLPPDLDRTSPLERRSDLLGRLLRLLSSVYFPQLKNSVGETLFAICDSDPSIMAAQLGYGNIAGFLFNKGIMAPPPPPRDVFSTPSTSASSTRPQSPAPRLNPITGTSTAPIAPNLSDEMTEEEKEIEAERLFMLFDRLERTGIGSVHHVRRPPGEGRITEIE